MLTIKCVSDKPCFICNRREDTAEVQFADKTFRGVLCMTHIFDKLRKEAGGAESAGRRPAA